MTNFGVIFIFYQMVKLQVMKNGTLIFFRLVDRSLYNLFAKIVKTRGVTWVRKPQHSVRALL